MLILLFLLSSTDLIIKEKKTEIYPVSVIIGETTDDYYTNFRKGVDKACLLYTSCGNGAAELIFLIVQARRPKRALLIAPSFLEYEQALKNGGCEISWFDLKEEEGFALSVPELTAHVKREAAAGQRPDMVLSLIHI